MTLYESDPDVVKSMTEKTDPDGAAANRETLRADGVNLDPDDALDDFMLPVVYMSRLPLGKQRKLNDYLATFLEKQIFNQVHAHLLSSEFAK